MRRLRKSYGTTAAWVLAKAPEDLVALGFRVEGLGFRFRVEG